MENRSVENTFSAAQVPAVGQDHGQTSQDSDLRLCASVPEPALRSEEAGRIGNRTPIKKWAELHGEKTVLINVFVHLPIGQKKSPPKRSGPFAAVESSRVAAQPKVVVALDAQFEQFVEGCLASARAGADSGLRLIIVTFCA